MATTDAFSLHTKGGIDLQDMLVAPFFSLAAVSLAGIGSFTLYGYSISATAFTGSGVNISYALIIAVLALGASWATNRAGDGWDDLDEIESAAVLGGALVVLGVAFVPFVQDLVYGSQAAGTVAFVLLTACYTVTAWY